MDTRRVRAARGQPPAADLAARQLPEQQFLGRNPPARPCGIPFGREDDSGAARHLEARDLFLLRCSPKGGGGGGGSRLYQKQPHCHEHPQCGRGLHTPVIEAALSIPDRRTYAPCAT